MLRVKVQYFDSSGNGVFVRFDFPFTLRQNPGLPMVELVDIGHRNWKVSILETEKDPGDLGAYRVRVKRRWGAN